MAPDALKSPPANSEEVACSFSAPSSYKMQSTDSFQPLQLKGEVLDMEFTVDTDHRKRRRNRTTQSCLNCHTSKRKCDRKRPCQRCIQLGLTGLCVYEIDDPALRDDPSVDENTRLRNRIAELESLVRELRGKPHPRWAESTFGNGDPNEKWHSRAAKCQPLAKRRGHSPARLGLGDIRSQSALMSPVKSEPSGENGGLYRFTPSPTSGRYNGYDQQGQQQQPGFDGSYSNTPSTSPSVTYSNANGSGPLPSSYSDGGYNLSGSDDGNVYGSDQYNQNICSCRTNPATGLAYIGLAQQLQSSLSSLRQYSHHPSNTTCSLYRRIVDLDNAMQYVPVARSQTADQAHSSHLSGNEPTETHPLSANGFASALPDRDITTPLSASSGHGSFHTGSSAGVAPQEWNALAAAGYNPYFPVHTEHNLYQQVIT